MDAEDIREIFRGLGPVQIRRMFGGQGVYRDELMFALVAAGELYLKTDDESVGLLSRAGSRALLLRDARREQDAHELLADARNRLSTIPTRRPSWDAWPWRRPGGRPTGKAKAAAKTRRRASGPVT